MSFVLPVALQMHLFSKNKNVVGYIQEANWTLLIKPISIQVIIQCSQHRIKIFNAAQSSPDFVTVGKTFSIL